MRRAGIYCVVMGLFVSACGGSGRVAVPLFLSCGQAVAEGATVRIRLAGNDFDFDLIDVDASDGDVANLTVDSPDLLSFDFTAPHYPAGTIGPVAITFTVSGPGVEPSSCSVLVHLQPFVATCRTTYTPNDHAAPTTGVYGGDFVVATITGGNFLEGGTMLVRPKSGIPLPLTEIGPLASFGAPGQFRVVNGTTVELTVPDVFSLGFPTILDGSPNAGPAELTYLSPFAALLVDEGCFTYASSFLDFTDYLFELPGSVADLGPVPGLMAPGKVKIGDVNVDGIPDIVVLVQQSVSAGAELPEAFLLLANTFGPGIDRDGDGKAPDFAGSFTAQTINHPDMQTLVPDEGRGQDILLTNLDDDEEMEIVLSVLEDSPEQVDPVMLVDIEPGGLVGALTILTPPITPDYTGGIAVGNFSNRSPHPDIAVLYGDALPDGRKLVVYSSVGAFDYESTVYDIPSPWDGYGPAAMGAGDFDGDGDDDLIWGLYDLAPGGAEPNELPILVTRVDADAGTVEPPELVTNLTGSHIADVEIFDANGDERDDAMVYVGGESDGSLVGTHLGAGVAVFLDVFSLEADSFTETAYRYAFWDRAGNGRALAHGDFDGDGRTDLATVADFGEILVLLGDGLGNFTDSGRSWQTVTGRTEFTGEVYSIDAADFDGDGLSEIVAGDMTNAPFNIVYWLNASR